MTVERVWTIWAILLDEMVLFCAVGFLIGAIDDCLFDLLWIANHVRKAVLIHRRIPRATLHSLPPPTAPGTIAIFVPAWDEGKVIGPMLRHAVALWGDGDAAVDYRIYVGTYPNDPATIEAVTCLPSPRVRHVPGLLDGPITKAECLNRLYDALCADEAGAGRRVKAIVLHDAEDVVHRDELALFERMIERADFVQIPVHPLVDPRSRWIAGHYCDEFAEMHGKTLKVREALGAAVPAAGVGCAFARDILARVARERGGAPFSEDSLTEDYELGLRVTELGARGIFVALPMAPGGDLIRVRAHFPATLEAAVRQKSRWIAGIALAGWDRLGWTRGFTERWMRLHDRRAIVAAMLVLIAYVALLMEAGMRLALLLTHAPRPPINPVLPPLLLACTLVLLWRLAVRFGFVRAIYGWREGMLAVPRVLVANVVAMIAVRRAVLLYLDMRRGTRIRWDKTDHHFPEIALD